MNRRIGLVVLLPAAVIAALLVSVMYGLLQMSNGPAYNTMHSHKASGVKGYYYWELVTAVVKDRHCVLGSHEQKLQGFSPKPLLVNLVLPIPSGVTDCQFGIVAEKLANSSTSPLLGTSYYEKSDAAHGGLVGLPIESLIVSLPDGIYRLTANGHRTDYIITVTT